MTTIAAPTETGTEAPAAAAGLGLFEKWLSLWVAAAILAGVVLGNAVPDAFAALAGLEYASVNLVVAVLIWAMIFPMMVAVDFGAVRRAGDKPRGLVITLVVNWLIKPFTMALLGVLFFEVVFAGLIAPADAQQYIAGLILLGAAPCTAMVFVWSQLTRGDPAYTLVQVAANDLVMIVAFAPIVALLLGVTDIAVPWETLLLSVVLYVVVPLVAGVWARHRLLRGHGGDERAVSAFTGRIKPLSIIGLLATVLLLFGFQAQTILTRPLLVALIGTSNFFELAVAVAIGLFGLGSGAALATVVGVLVEVPVMLSLVAIANRTRQGFAAG
jgi:ACR3 family arsenite transporter